MNQLFRSEALNANRAQGLGDIVLVAPVSHRIIAAGATLTAALILLFLFFGAYTQRTTVAGELMPDSGLVKVYGAQRGMIREKLVVEGQFVERGDPLFVLSSERHSRTQNNVLEAISDQVKSRLESWRQERSNTLQFHRNNREAIVQEISSLEMELEKSEKVIEGQQQRVIMARNDVARYRGLSKKGYVSLEQLQRREEDLLDQRNHLQVRERELIALRRELMSRRNTLSALASEQANQLEQIDRNIARLKQELSETEARRELIVAAPEAGVATAVTAEIGQVVDSHQPLLSIVPDGARLQAILYVPSAAVGFVKAKDAVQIRYQAFPYQKFGHGKANVLSISQAPMAGNELPSVGGSSNTVQAGAEPLYRITAKLESQTILALGKPKPLRAGMLLEADIMRETRRLYEWVLEPLYSITGKL